MNEIETCLESCGNQLTRDEMSGARRKATNEIDRQNDVGRCAVTFLGTEEFQNVLGNPM